MRYIFFILVISVTLQAGIFDFLDIKGAKDSYIKNDFNTSIKSLQKLKTKNDQALYDLANSYYKAKDYKKALKAYEGIKDKNLEFKKLHNMGNTQAQLGKIDEAIKSYESALKIKDDSDTKYNLELLKKKKKEKKKKDQKKNKDQKKKNKKDQNKKDQNKKDQNKKDQNKKQNKKQNKNNQKKQDQKNKKQDQKKDKKGKKGDSKQKKDQDKKKKNSKKSKSEKTKQNKDKKQKKQQQALKKAMKKEPISDREVRKYQKMLNKRGVNTLLVPLKSKGEKDENIKPW